MQKENPFGSLSLSVLLEACCSPSLPSSGLCLFSSVSPSRRINRSYGISNERSSRFWTSLNVKKTEDEQKQVRIGCKRSLLREIFFSGQGKIFSWAGRKSYLPRAYIGELFHNRHIVKLFSTRREALFLCQEQNHSYRSV